MKNRQHFTVFKVTSSLEFELLFHCETAADRVYFLFSSKSHEPGKEHCPHEPRFEAVGSQLLFRFLACRPVLEV